MSNKKLKKRKQQAAAMLEDNSKLLVKDKENAADGKAEESNMVEEMSESLDRFETWAIANGKYILTACILVLIGVAIYLTVSHLRAKSIEADTAKLAEAVKIEQLESALKTISASIPGYDTAQIRLARLYAADKKYDQAYACFIAVADRKNEPYLCGRSRLDAAYMKELAGKTAEAAAVFAMVADSPDMLADLRAEGAYGAGRLFLLLKNENAARKYLSMTDPAKATTQGSSQWAMLAQALLNRMPSAVKPAAVPVKPAAPAPAKPAAANKKPAAPDQAKPAAANTKPAVPAQKNIPAAKK